MCDLPAAKHLQAFFAPPIPPPMILVAALETEINNKHPEWGYILRRYPGGELHSAFVCINGRKWDYMATNRNPYEALRLAYLFALSVVGEEPPSWMK